MKQTFSEKVLAEVCAKLGETDLPPRAHDFAPRAPVHVVYGGAHLFRAETPAKLGAIAVKSLDDYAPDFAEFARAMWLSGADALPVHDDARREIEWQLVESESQMKEENFPAWFAWTVYRRTREKLAREPVEDLRIDFEDGYGFRPDTEEDGHALAAADELARSFLEKIVTPFCGFRVKSFQPETRRRAVRTLDLFLTRLLEKTDGALPANFVVTLPKISRSEEVAALAWLLDEFERRNGLTRGTLKLEIMIETPQSIVGENGRIVLRDLTQAGGGRVVAAHFGAFDYTASFGISGAHQHLRHDACNFARQMMQIAFAPLGVRLSDSVTTEMPVPVHKGEGLTKEQSSENRRVVHAAWRKHYNNVTRSLIDGFYQSWDLHPAQLAARYAAVYAFFLESKDAQSARLRRFVEAATRATLSGNTFDDAASANGLLNFFRQALSSGALTENEISRATALSADELKSGSFAKIMEMRQD